MSLQGGGLANQTQRKLQQRYAGSLAARMFGQDDGSLFDLRALPPARVAEFCRNAEVREAAWEFAVQVMRLWAQQNQGFAPLRPSEARITPLPLAELSESPPSPSHPTTAGQATMDPSSAKPPAPPATPQPASAPPGSATLQTTAKAGAIPATDPAQPSPAVERKVAFSAPNAKSGEAYRAAVEARHEQGRKVAVLSARLPVEIGLAFDPATREIHGVPTQAGEHTVTVQWQDDHGAGRTGSFVLIVNANPRDLWKEIDADPKDPYFKPNADSRALEASGSRIAAASKRGRSHAHAGTCRDDDFHVTHDAASGWSVLVVADGAGSAKSSRRGAALAASKAGGHLTAELSGDEGPPIASAIADWQRDAAAGARPLKDRLYHLFGKAAWAALRAIEDEAGGKSAPVKDYSTTLLCAVHRKTGEGHFVASFWLGDGAICAYGPPGQALLMGKPDSGEFAGQTRFLDRAALSDSAGLWSRIEFSRHDSLTALILMTDGISDPRFETDNGLADAARWDSLWAELTPALAAPEPDKALVDWMDFFTPGHHDDRTIALLW